MSRILNSLFLLLISLSIHAEMVDAISVVFNEQIITKSEIERIKSSIAGRAEFSPLVYGELTASTPQLDNQIADILVQALMVREVIGKVGYVVSDSDVENRIKYTESSLGLSREDLIEFIKTKNLTFEEYFELIKQMNELGIFNSRIIQPLISVTEQEIKEYFLNSNKSNKSITVFYDFINFSIPKGTEGHEGFRDAVKRYIATGIIDEKFKDFKSDKITDVSEESLSHQLVELFRSTNEGDISTLANINGESHCFFLIKKNISESEFFKKSKENIRQEIVLKKAQTVKKQWFENNYGNYYIKKLIL